MISENTGEGIIHEQYRNSIRKEVFRKLIHICSAVIPLLLSFWYTPVIILLVIADVFYCISEFLRMKGINVPVISHITQIAARKRDENHFVAGPVTLVAGIVMTALLWQPDPARIGIYALSFGDGLASLCGKLFGHIYIPLTHGKTAAGSLTCFTAVFISSFAVCRNAFTSFVLAGTAMMIEVLPRGDFDNLIIPVVVGGLAQVLLP